MHRRRRVHRRAADHREDAMIPGIETLIHDHVDTPDWEKDLDDPAPALSHQMLIASRQ